MIMTVFRAPNLKKGRTRVFQIIPMAIDTFFLLIGLLTATGFVSESPSAMVVSALEFNSHEKLNEFHTGTDSETLQSPSMHLRIGLASDHPQSRGPRIPLKKIQRQRGEKEYGGRRSSLRRPVSALVELGKPALNKCQVCVFVLEKIKGQVHNLLPSVCSDLFTLEATDKSETFKDCNMVLTSLSEWGENIRHWWHFGCYKQERYGEMELVTPCPSQAICSQIMDLRKKEYCKPTPQDHIYAYTRGSVAQSMSLDHKLPMLGEQGAAGACLTCIYVVERIRQGYPNLFGGICREVLSKAKPSGTKNALASYAACHELLDMLSEKGPEVRKWLNDGCYHAEKDGAMESIVPCPSHAICAVMPRMHNLEVDETEKQENFCSTTPAEGLRSNL